MTRKRKSKSKKPAEFQMVHRHAAGIDIGASFHVVAVGSDKDDEPIRTFPCFTSDLRSLSTWLLSLQVTTVAMESTSVYWIPLYEILQDCGIEVVLVNARHAKGVPGRKTDVNDAQWLQQLHSYGLLRGSFLPTAEISELRSYLRHRDKLVKSAATELQRIQKSMTLMNVQLQHVIADISGVTGMKIIRAIVKGERCPKTLSQFRDVRCRSSIEVIESALTGNYQPQHVFTLRHALELFDFIQTQIADCDKEIDKLLKELNSEIESPKEPIAKRKSPKPKRGEPDFDVRQALYTFTGVDLTQIHGIGPYTALRLIGECGTDMSRWPSAKHFASWLCLSPGNKISGGKVLSAKTQRTANQAAALLRIVAMTAGRTQTALGAFYRRLAARVGKSKAITATARKIAVLFYNALKHGLKYKDPGADYYEAEYRKRVVRNLHRRARQLGLKVIEEPIAG